LKNICYLTLYIFVAQRHLINHVIQSNMKKPFLFFFIIFYSTIQCFSQSTLETVDKVDLQKYAGKWYEICHMPVSFLEGCNCITATYTLDQKGFVRVFNKCRKSNGKWTSINGKAFTVKGSWNSKLKVQFFWPFRADYYILELAEDYSYAVVGEPGRRYLWILSRTPQMDPALYQDLVQKCGNKGFAVEYLVVTSQEGCGE
jgi:apolipoprotein D and lipocalin family protein